MKKKLFSIIMCVLMVMCFMPTAAFATGTYESDTTISTDTTISESTSISATVTVNSGKTLTIGDGATLTITGSGKLVVNGTLEVEAGGTLDLTGVSTSAETFTNSYSADSRTLKIANGANLIVNGTLKSKAQFNDILQLGTMTINSGATVIVGNISNTDITYIGAGGTIVLGTGAQIVQKPRVADTFANGYTYELSGSATVGSLDSNISFGTMYVSGKDQFIVKDKAILTVNKMAMATGGQTGTVPTLENHIIVKSGGTLAVAEGGTLDLSVTSGATTYNDNTIGQDKRLILIEQGGKFDVSGTLKSNNSFNDICQYGTMTIKSGAVIYASSENVYIGNSTTAGSVATLTSGEIVSSKRGETFAQGYNYTLQNGTIKAEAGFATYGKDIFVIASGSTLEVGTAEALNAGIGCAANGATLKLSDNITLASQLDISKNITLDFNGKTITSNNNYIAILVKDGANVTFKDSSAAGNGGIKNTCTSYDTGKTIRTTGENTKLTIENGTYKSDSLGDVAMIDAVEGASVTIKGGTFTTAKDSSGAKKEGKVFYSGADSYTNGNQEKHGKIVVTGGTFTGRLSTSNWGVYEISGGTFDRNTVVKYNNPANDNSTNSGETVTLAEAGMIANGYYVVANSNNTYTVYRYYSSGGSRSGSSTTTDNVVNTTETTKTDAGATTTVPETKATVKAETKTAADGTKTTTSTVDTTTAAKIVEKAVENKSEEVIVNAGTTAVAETAAGTTTEVAIPAETVSQIAEKTTAAVTIETEAAEVSLDEKAVEAVAEQAGETGSVKLVVETKAQDENKVEVELKIETSNGAVSDFKGGNVTVTVKLNSALAAKPVICVYIDDNGVYHKVAGHKNADGTYTFTTGHFSTYAIMSVEDADAAIAKQADSAKELVKALSLKATSSKTKKGNIKVKLSVNADKIKAIEDLGYTVKYKFYRSTKKSSSYKAKFETIGKTYTNTAGKKGTRYYYKARVLVYDTDGTLVTYTALKQCKYATRVR